MVPSTLLLTYVGSSLQLSGLAMVCLAAVFLILFVGVPVLLHRYNWCNIQDRVSFDEV